MIGTLAVDEWDVTFWYSEEGTARAAAPPSPFIAVPNVTAHRSAKGKINFIHSMMIFIHQHMVGNASNAAL